MKLSKRFNAGFVYISVHILKRLAYYLIDILKNTWCHNWNFHFSKFWITFL